LYDQSKKDALLQDQTLLELSGGKLKLRGPVGGTYLSIFMTIGICLIVMVYELKQNKDYVNNQNNIGKGGLLFNPLNALTPNSEYGKKFGWHAQLSIIVLVYIILSSIGLLFKSVRLVMTKASQASDITTQIQG